MKLQYAIVYTGAPYGGDPKTRKICGHIISRHKSLFTAARKYERLFCGNTGMYSHVIRRIDNQCLSDAEFDDLCRICCEYNFVRPAGKQTV